MRKAGFKNMLKMTPALIALTGIFNYASAFSNYFKINLEVTHLFITSFLIFLIHKKVRLTFATVGLLIYCCKSAKIPADTQLMLFETGSFIAAIYLLRNLVRFITSFNRSNNPDISYHVDHIFPRSLFPHLALERKNLQVLCSHCNIQKSNTSFVDYRNNKKNVVNKPQEIGLANRPVSQKDFAVAELGVSDEFYKSAQWRKLRNKTIEKFGRTCMNQRCPN